MTGNCFFEAPPLRRVVFERRATEKQRSYGRFPKGSGPARRARRCVLGNAHSNRRSQEGRFAPRKARRRRTWPWVREVHLGGRGPQRPNSKKLYTDEDPIAGAAIPRQGRHPARRSTISPAAWIPVSCRSPALISASSKKSRKYCAPEGTSRPRCCAHDGGSTCPVNRRTRRTPRKAEPRARWPCRAGTGCWTRPTGRTKFARLCASPA